MGIADCLIVGMIALWMAVALYFLHRKKKSGGCPGCCGNCGGCGECGGRK